jgi:hypothetical protein
MFLRIGNDFSDETGAIVAFLMLPWTTVDWSVLGKVAKEVFTSWDLVNFLLKLLAILTLMGAMAATLALTCGATGTALVALVMAKSVILLLAIMDLIDALLATHKECFDDVDIVGEDCDGFYRSGGQGTSIYLVNLKNNKGVFKLSYNMYSVPDQLEAIYEDNVIFTTGGLVSGSREVKLSIDGLSKQLEILITAPSSGTGWNFGVSCPCNIDTCLIGCCFDTDYPAGRTCTTNKKCSCDTSLAGVDCCIHDDCNALAFWSVCVDEKCCTQDTATGVECCCDEDCEDNSSICVANKCECSTLHPNVECCAESDCIGYF